jgi:hypothetical protein
MSVESELNRFGKVVVKESRTALTKQKRNVSKDLYNSLKYDVKVSKNSFEMNFYMSDYGQFQDKGVQGKSSSAKAPNSPFKFGKSSGKKKQKGGLSDSIFEWVKARRFQFQDTKKYNKNATGRFMSYKNTAFLISRSIYHKGLKPTKFFSKPFEAAFKRLPDDLVKAYGLQLDKFLANTLK